MNIWTDIATKICGVDMQSIAYRMCEADSELINQVRGSRRDADLVKLRHQIAKQARKEGFTLQEIGDYLNRDHSTVSYYINNYQPIN